MKKLCAVMLMVTLIFDSSFSKNKDDKYVAALDDQNKWAKCEQCSSLFYNGYRDKGRCPISSSGVHKWDGGRDYLLFYNSPGPGQSNWRFCYKCKALFYDGYTNKGICKGGGGHVAAGYNFILR